jgi:Na+-driven multidrug efflux pump
MTHALAGMQLMAALSIKFQISWPRFILSMLVLAGLIYGAAYSYGSGNDKKKKKK